MGWSGSINVSPAGTDGARGVNRLEATGKRLTG
jgi:hypothetical protein